MNEFSSTHCLAPSLRHLPKIRTSTPRYVIRPNATREQSIIFSGRQRLYSIEGRYGTLVNRLSGTLRFFGSLLEHEITTVYLTPARVPPRTLAFD